MNFLFKLLIKKNTNILLLFFHILYFSKFWFYVLRREIINDVWEHFYLLIFVLYKLHDMKFYMIYVLKPRNKPILVLKNYKISKLVSHFVT